MIRDPVDLCMGGLQLTSKIKINGCLSLFLVVFCFGRFLFWSFLVLVAFCFDVSEGGEEGLIASFSVLDKVQTNITYLLNENVVLGPLSIVGVRAVPVSCNTTFSMFVTFAVFQHRPL